MGTEYRRGIPSVAHIEAATRLGLVWHRQGHSEDIVTVFKVAPDGVRSNYGTRTILEENSFLPLHRQERSMYYRPIRTDGTLVDWNVLDAEAQYANMPVAQPQPEPRRFVDVRPDRHGVIPTDEQGNPVSWERIAQPTPTAAPAQPQGFRADLWQRMLRSFFGDRLSEVDTTGLRLARITAREHDRMFYFDNGDALLLSGMSDAGYTDADILARWAVYQELKPLYDLVAGAQGEAPMPEDAILELARRSGWETYPREALLRRTDELQIRETASGWTWSSDDDSTCGNQLCNFAAVLDTVAEQRVATRAGQTQSRAASQQQPSPTVSPQPRLGVDTTVSFVAANPSSTPHPTAPQPSYFTADGDTASTPAAAPPWLHQMCAEMRATASWQRVDGLQITFCLPYGRKLTQGQLDRVRRNINPPGDIDATVTRFTVAATNRPAPPVPVCIVAAMRRNQDLAVLSPDNSIPGEHDAAVAWSQLDDATSQLCRNVVHDIVEHACYGLDDEAAAQRACIYAQLISEAQTLKVEVATHVRSWCSQFQTRTVLLELDDVDHSQSTKLDRPLKRGKLPTASQIGKYREVMAKRSGTAAEALKASGIDCEVAQYVLERWTGGLSDETTLWLLRDVGKYCRPGLFLLEHARIDELAEQAIKRPALDIAEPTDDSAQRQLEEREAQRRRMAALQAQLAAERAARTVEPQPEPTRFDLLECDPKADPAVSIAAWEARQKRSTVRPMPMPEPQPWSHCLPFEIVDAEAEGLRPGAAFTAFLGRALNPNC